MPGALEKGLLTLRPSIFPREPRARLTAAFWLRSNASDRGRVCLKAAEVCRRTWQTIGGGCSPPLNRENRANNGTADEFERNWRKEKQNRGKRRAAALERIGRKPNDAEIRSRSREPAVARNFRFPSPRYTLSR